MSIHRASDKAPMQIDALATPSTKKAQLATYRAEQQPVCAGCGEHDAVRPIFTAGALVWEWFCAVSFGGCGRRWQEVKRVKKAGL